MQSLFRPNHDAKTPPEGTSGRKDKSGEASSASSHDDPLRVNPPREKPGPHADANVRFEPLPRHNYDLSYACLLIPRAESHLLTGKIPDFLQTTIQQICTFFGWRLDSIQVRPEYMQWVVSAPAATPPSKCIRTIREQTSKGLLDKYREFREKNPLQDFWAPGYLVLVGPVLHPPEVISEFIRLTRQQQALRPPVNT